MLCVVTIKTFPEIFKLLKQGYIYIIKFEKHFLNSTTGTKSQLLYTTLGKKNLLQQGISEPIFYGDLVYKFKQIVGKPNFSDQFKKIIKRYIKVGYNLDVMRQSCMPGFKPIHVYGYGFLFNCTTVAQASDSMMALT